MSEHEKPAATLSQLGNAISEALVNVCDDVAKVAVFVAERYADAGMLYGPTSEDLWRWMKELVNNSEQ